MTRRLTTAETLARILDSFAQDLHVALPGVVRSYDAETQTADVRLGLQRVLQAEDEDQDEDLTENLPILPSVPVVFPRGGGYFLSFPLAAGDGVLVVFNELDINAWRDSSGEAVDPGVGLRHGLSGAVAVPGMFTRGDALASASGVYARLGRDAGPFIDLRGDEIWAGGSLSLAEAPNLGQHLSAISTALDGLAARIAAVGGGSATDANYGAAAKSALDSSNPIATTVTKGT